MKHHHLTYLLTFFLILNTSCIDKTTNKNEGTGSSIFYERTDKMKAFLLSKKINSLAQVLGTKINPNENYLIYYITGQDCGSCVSKGFQAIKMLEPRLRQKITPVGSSINIGNIQLYYDYQSIIYPDNQDMIRKELGYFHSPMFLWYSTDEGIKDTYFIPTF